MKKYIEEMVEEYRGLRALDEKSDEDLMREEELCRLLDHHVAVVAQDFLARRATIGELRAAVRAAKGE